MKLLFVLPEFGVDVRGGVATYYRHLIPALQRAGCTVDVCLAPQREITGPSAGSDGVAVRLIDRAEVERAAARYVHLAAVPGLRSAVATAFAAWESCAGGRGYDIVEVTDWGSLYVPWLLAASTPPVIVQLHGSGGQVDYYDPFEGAELSGMMLRLLETALLGRADELQAYGRPNAAEWSRLLNRPVQHIWPAWSAATVAPVAADIPAGAFGVVAGRIQSWKGPEVLCQAVARLGAAAPEIRWIGSDHPFRRLDRSLSDHLRQTYPDVWGKRVVPLGEMSPARTAAMQRSARFVVVPSIWDTFNLTAAEAMGAGKVVICSEGAGAAGLIEHGRNGFRFPVGDAASLAELLVQVTRLSPSERDLIGGRAKETVTRELDVDAVAARRVERFRRLKEAPRSPRGNHPWLDNIFAASADRPAFAFLKDVPLRILVRHMTSRIIDRLRAKPR
jgi:glycosyltransferase involved in cell wall biosynthesis